MCGLCAAGGKKKCKSEYESYDSFAHVKSPWVDWDAFFVPYDMDTDGEWDIYGG